MYGRGKPPSVVWHGTGHECQKVKMYYQVSYVELQLLRGIQHTHQENLVGGYYLLHSRNI